MPPIVAAAAIGAGASIIGGAESSRASKNAAQIQADSAAKALAVQQQVYAQNQANRAPYLAAGQQAVGQLGQLAGQNTRMNLPASYGPYGNSSPSSAPQIGSPQTPQPPAPPQAPGSQGPLVTVQAPTGETQDFPMNIAQQLVAKGARILGPAQSQGNAGQARVM